MHTISYLKQFKNLIHGVSVCRDGNMSYRYGNKKLVRKNRIEFLHQLGVEGENTVAMLNQHTNNFHHVSEGDKGKGIYDITSAIKVDGLIADQKGIYLFLLVADCQPIIVFEPKRQIVGLFHAGWRNIVAGAAEAILGYMKGNFELKTSDLHVVIGPAVQQDSYRFSEFEQKDKLSWQPFIAKYGEDDYGLDLVGYNKERFLNAGVSSNQLFVSNIDTAKDKRFFSHVYDAKNQPEKEGRFAVVVGWSI